MPIVCSVEYGPDPPAGETKIRRNPLFAEELITSPYKDKPTINTPFACFEESAKLYPEDDFLGHRSYEDDGSRGAYQWQSYGSAFKEVKDWGVGLVNLCKLKSTGGGASGQPRVGIYSMNRPECTKALLAFFSQNFINVPLYDTLGHAAVQFIIDQAEVSTCFCERSKLDNLLKGKGKALKNVVLFETPTDEEKEACKKASVALFSVADLADSARTSPGATNAAKPEDWAYIMYTSGTTGDPKGVILSHQNVISSAAGLHRGVSDTEELARHTDVYISYLPMAHSFEVCMQMCMIVAGAKIGFYQGDVRKLVSDDLPALKPTLFAGVPRVYGRVYDKVMAGLEEKGPVAKALYDTAFANQSWCMSMGFRNPLWDLLLFNKIKDALGGRVRMMATGAAPLGATVHNFLRVCFGVPVSQGYGMTENAAPAAAQMKAYNGLGDVGGPVPCTEIKLMDTEDYKAADLYPSTKEEFEKQVSFKGEFQAELAGKRLQRGEVCLRGTNVFQGYYKMEKETQETLIDGWLHTGDIGMWQDDGALAIIDRKKNIFKLAQGEYVAPDSSEQCMQTCPFVAQVWVYGSSLETCVVAIVVPDTEVLVAHAKKAGWPEAELKAICARAEVKQMILDGMIGAGKAAKLRSFELPKDIYLETDVDKLGQGFTVENDTLTPTFKLRRPQLQKKYQKLIDSMYADLKAKGLC